MLLGLLCAVARCWTPLATCPPMHGGWGYQQNRHTRCNDSSAGRWSLVWSLAMRNRKPKPSEKRFPQKMKHRTSQDSTWSTRTRTHGHPVLSRRANLGLCPGEHGWRNKRWIGGGPTRFALFSWRLLSAKFLQFLIPENENGERASLSIVALSPVPSHQAIGEADSL